MKKTIFAFIFACTLNNFALASSQNRLGLSGYKTSLECEFLNGETIEIEYLINNSTVEDSPDLFIIHRGLYHSKVSFKGSTFRLDSYKVRTLAKNMIELKATDLTLIHGLPGNFIGETVFIIGVSQFFGERLLGVKDSLGLIGNVGELTTKCTGSSKSI